MSDVNPPVVQAPPKKPNTGMIIAIVLSVIGVFLLLVCAGIVFGLLLPAVNSQKVAAKRMQCSNNLKQIALAMHNYADEYKRFPPAYTTDAAGRRLHSWRTLILPYLEERALYDSIDLNKPWDDPVNQHAASTSLAFFNCPASSDAVSNKTSYQVVVDPGSAFPGAQAFGLQHIIDGTSNTLMVTETPDSMAVPWMSPEDCDLQEFLSYTEAHHTKGFNIVTCDGAVHFISANADQKTREALVSRGGAEPISLD